MKRPLNAVLRSVAWFQMRSLETTLQGKLDIIHDITDRETKAAMRASIRQLRKDLAKARAKYQSLLPVGERHVWNLV